MLFRNKSITPLKFACLIRVPADNIRQRAQVNADRSTLSIFRDILRRDGLRGFYRSYLTTLLREIPFGSIQFPLWEYFKLQIKRSSKDGKCEPFHSAICGALAGRVKIFKDNLR